MKLNKSKKILKRCLEIHIPLLENKNNDPKCHAIVGYNPITKLYPSLPWGFLAQEILDKIENGQEWADDYNQFLSLIENM